MDWFEPEFAESREWLRFQIPSKMSGFRISYNSNPPNFEKFNRLWVLSKISSENREIGVISIKKKQITDTVTTQGYLRLRNESSELMIGNLSVQFVGGAQFQTNSNHTSDPNLKSIVKPQLNPSENQWIGIAYLYRMYNYQFQMGGIKQVHRSSSNKFVWFQPQVSLSDGHHIQTSILSKIDSNQPEEFQFQSFSLFYQKITDYSSSYVSPLFTRSGNLYQFGTKWSHLGTVHLDWFGVTKAPFLDNSSSRFRNSKHGFYGSFNLSFQKEFKISYQYRKVLDNSMEERLSVILNEVKSIRPYTLSFLYLQNEENTRTSFAYTLRTHSTDERYFFHSRFQQLKSSLGKQRNFLFTSGVEKFHTSSLISSVWTSIILGNRSSVYPSLPIGISLLQSVRNPYLSETGAYLGSRWAYRYRHWSLQFNVSTKVDSEWQESSYFEFGLLNYWVVN